MLERALADAERGLGGAGSTAGDEALAAIAAARRRRRAPGAEPARARGRRRRLAPTPRRRSPRRRQPRRRSARSLLYDKAGEEHYNLISALHKSLRETDADAALYWLARMLEAGEDPLYVARRLVRFASEDVGLADPQALPQALAARDAYQLLGHAGGGARARAGDGLPRARAEEQRLYRAYGAARRDVEERPADPVPLASATRRRG